MNDGCNEPPICPNLQFDQGHQDIWQKRMQAAQEEKKQLHNCIVFKPIKVEELTAIKRTQAMESLIFITKKKDGRIKARTVEFTPCGEIFSFLHSL
jgi:hypothetical protein